MEATTMPGYRGDNAPDLSNKKDRKRWFKRVLTEEYD